MYYTMTFYVPRTKKLAAWRLIYPDTRKRTASIAGTSEFGPYENRCEGQKEKKRLLITRDEFWCLLDLRLCSALDEFILVFIREVFECPALGLRKQQGGEDAGQHEQGEDLEDVRDKLVGAADVLQLRESDLGNDRTELARGGRDTVRGGAVTGRENLARNDKGRGVWSCRGCIRRCAVAA